MASAGALEVAYSQGLLLDGLETTDSRRRLENFGGFNWILVFLLGSGAFIYCCRYQFCPRWLRFYRFMYAKRLTHVLDSFDAYEEMFEDSKRTMQVDPETGELYWVEERMAQQAAAEGEEALTAEAAGGSTANAATDGESKEDSRGGGQFDEEHGNLLTTQTAEGEVEGGNTPPRRKKAKPRPMSPKKLAQLQQKREEAEAYAEACRKAIYVPLREEKLRIVREQFEKQIESGNMGWQLTVEQKNAIGPSIVNGMQLRDPRSVKYFHDLAFQDKMERGRPKKKHYPKDDPKAPKQRRSPSPKSRDANAGSPSKIAKQEMGKGLGLPTRSPPGSPKHSPGNSPSPTPQRASSPPLSVVRSSTAPVGGLRQR